MRTTTEAPRKLGGVAFLGTPVLSFRHRATVDLRWLSIPLYIALAIALLLDWPVEFIKQFMSTSGPATYEHALAHSHYYRAPEVRERVVRLIATCAKMHPAGVQHVVRKSRVVLSWWKSYPQRSRARYRVV
ncbi:MAG: hypothetical protein ACXW2I_11835 [Burkholderiales bacterium]